MNGNSKVSRNRRVERDHRLCWRKTKGKQQKTLEGSLQWMDMIDKDCTTLCNFWGRMRCSIWVRWCGGKQRPIAIIQTISFCEIKKKPLTHDPENMTYASISAKFSSLNSAYIVHTSDNYCTWTAGGLAGGWVHIHTFSVVRMKHTKGSRRLLGIYKVINYICL